MDVVGRGHKSSLEPSKDDNPLGLASGSKTIKKKLKTILAKRKCKLFASHTQELETQNQTSGPFFEIAKRLAHDDKNQVSMPPEPNSLDLDSFLNDPSNREDFLEFLKRNHSEESLEFWFDYQQYKHICDTSTLNDRRNKAIEMFTRYLSFAAEKPINVDERASMEVCRALAHPRETTFDEALNQVVDLLRTDCYQRYYQHKKQLIASSQQSTIISSNSPNSRTSYIDSSPDVAPSVSTDFPDSEDLRSLVEKMKRNHEESLTRVDSSQLANDTQITETRIGDCVSDTAPQNVSELNKSSSTTTTSDTKNRSYSSYYKCLELPSLDEELLSATSDTCQSTQSKSTTNSSRHHRHQEQLICKRCLRRVKTRFKLPEASLKHQKRQAHIQRVNNVSHFSSNSSAFGVVDSMKNKSIKDHPQKTISSMDTTGSSVNPAKNNESVDERILVAAQQSSCIYTRPLRCHNRIEGVTNYRMMETSGKKESPNST